MVGGTGDDLATCATSAAPPLSIRNILDHKNWSVPRSLSGLAKYTSFPSSVLLSRANCACALVATVARRTAFSAHCLVLTLVNAILSYSKTLLTVN